jgi:hypothetical protein
MTDTREGSLSKHNDLGRPVTLPSSKGTSGLRSKLSLSLGAVLIATIVILQPAGDVLAQCAAKPPLQNWDAANRNPCLCFIPGEEAGAIFTAPAADYPLEILQVGIYWTSQFGGNPASLEQGIHIYAGGLPNPGAPVFTLPGPTLTDGILNVFILGSPVQINSGPFTVTLEFLNQSSGNQFASSLAEDGPAGCRPGQNVVFTGGQWSDACVLGVGGDWVIEVVYRPCAPPVPVDQTTWGAIKALY